MSVGQDNTKRLKPAKASHGRYAARAMAFDE